MESTTGAIRAVVCVVPIIATIDERCIRQRLIERGRISGLGAVCDSNADSAGLVSSASTMRNVQEVVCWLPVVAERYASASKLEKV